MSKTSLLRSQRNFGEILFVQDNYVLMIVVPGSTSGFYVRLLAPIVNVDATVDPLDKKVLRILYRSSRDSVPSMIRVGPSAEEMQRQEETATTLSGRYGFLLKPNSQSSIWKMTIAFETTQGCALAALHIEKRRIAVTQERIDLLKHFFDEIVYLDIIDANAGSHGKAFATNFNPEINIREVTQKGKYWENGDWVITEPHEIKMDIDYPNIGPKSSYLIYHEELESLVQNFSSLKRARFWMTFSEEYLTHLRVIQNIGMANIEPVMFQGREIIPLEFLKAVLPDPGELGENYTGQTSIGVRIRGKKDGKWVNYYIWNNCQHADAYKETGTQGVSYTTGVPTMIGAKMFLTGQWSKPGVYNVEEFNPDPFLEALSLAGLPWHEQVNGNLQFDYPA
jgi:hypothetical protein